MKALLALTVRNSLGGAADNRNIHLAAIANWYEFLIEHRLTEHNPARRVKRETVSDEGTTPAWTTTRSPPSSTAPRA